MSHSALVRAEQDLVLRDSLAGSSLSALTVVVAVMLLSVLLARPEREPGFKVFEYPPESPPHDLGDYTGEIPVVPPSDAFVVRETEKEPEIPAFDEPPPISGGGEGLRNGHVTDTPLVGGDGTGVVREPLETIPPPDTFIWTEELPRVSYRVEPVYPDVPRQAGMEGKVWVRIFVGVDGRVKRAEIEGRASIFDESALTAVRQWGFTPAKANGQPVAVWMRIPVVFTLD